jgi:translation elongation factor EF-Ts
MFDLAAEMQADVKAAPDSENLSAVAALAERQLDLQRSIDIQSENLAKTQAALRKIQEEELPTLMQSVGLLEFRLVNGAKITVKKFYSGSIKDENRDQAFSWLAEHNHDDIIKNDYTIGFGKGEDSKAGEFEQELTAMGVPFKHKKHVHPQTLNAFIREQVESGADFPLETFGVFIGNRAIIK